MLGGRLLAARSHDLEPRLKTHLLVLDVLAQHPAQDLRDSLVGELDTPVQRIDLAAVRSGIFEDTHDHAGLVLGRNRSVPAGAERYVKQPGAENRREVK